MEKAFQKGNPPRQGFYEAQTKGGVVLIAEWREYDKKQGKVWWQHVSDHPTHAKEPVLLEGVTGWRTAEKAAVEKALARELTLEEKIQKSYAAFQSQRSLYPEKRWPVPANRRLQIGDKVEIGNLKDVEVIALHEEGEAVTVRYQELRNGYGDRLDHNKALGTWFWMDVLKLSDQQKTCLTSESATRHLNYLNSSISSLVSRMAHCGTDDNPDYQRGYVWTMDDKYQFLDSLFEGRDLGRFIFVRYAYPKDLELFDGKQRMSTVMDFVSSRFPYKGVYWHQMSKRDRRTIEDRAVQYADLNGESLTRADLLKIFLAVNAAGVPQTEEHLQHVRTLLEQELAKAA